MQMGINVTELKISLQSVIDCLALMNKENARLKLVQTQTILDDLTDCATTDDDLIELSKYQVLLSQLQQKAEI